MGKKGYKQKNVKTFNEITMLMEEYTDEIRAGIEQVASELAESGVEELKKVSPKRYGKYAKSWTSRATIGANFVNFKIYNAKHYRLTHLLEKGHALRDGGRTKSIVHIKPVEQRIIEEFETRVKKVIENGGAQ